MIKMPVDAIGKELIIDLYACNLQKMQRKSLDEFFVVLCDEINMTRTELFYWEYLDDPNKDPEEFSHLQGLSAVQFIKTSNITVHTFDNDRKVSINLFSCKDFNEDKAEFFIQNYFNGKVKVRYCVIRY